MASSPSSASSQLFLQAERIFLVLTMLFLWLFKSQLLRFDTPFGNKPVLQPAAISDSAVGKSSQFPYLLQTDIVPAFTGIAAAFDDADKIVLTVTYGRYLSLFDLKTTSLKDTVTVFNLYAFYLCLTFLLIFW